MSTQDGQADMAPTKTVAEHEWLQKLIGEWKTESEMTMPDGTAMGVYRALGYDVSFKE